MKKPIPIDPQIDEANRLFMSSIEHLVFTHYCRFAPCRRKLTELREKKGRTHAI